MTREERDALRAEIDRVMRERVEAAQAEAAGARGNSTNYETRRAGWIYADKPRRLSDG